MAKKIYVGVSSKARKVKAMYVGVNSKARRITKAYVGVGGIARKIWPSEFSYYGSKTAKITNPTAATTVGSYALFGSCGTPYSTNDVEYFNSSLTNGSASTLYCSTDSSYKTRGVIATTVNNYAIFGSGDILGKQYGENRYLTGYNTSLTRKYVQVTGYNIGGLYAAATSIGNYAIFAGGFADGYSMDYLLAVNSSLTYQSLDYSHNRHGLSATTVGNYAIFAGGDYNDDEGSYYFNTAYAYDSSLTERQLSNMSKQRFLGAATTIGSYALFAGGKNDTAGSSKYFNDSVDAYDTSLTKSSAPVLNIARFELAATSVGDYAMFGGGSAYSTSYCSDMDLYDKSLTHTVTTGLSVARSGIVATTIGSYALFAGGSSSNYKLDIYSA